MWFSPLVALLGWAVGTAFSTLLCMHGHVAVGLGLIPFWGLAVGFASVEWADRR